MPDNGYAISVQFKNRCLSQNLFNNVFFVEKKKH